MHVHIYASVFSLKPFENGICMIKNGHALEMYIFGFQYNFKNNSLSVNWLN